MWQRYTLNAMTLLTVVATATAQPTVTLNLDSSSDGLTVQPGTMIDWAITVGVSAGDNEGLALIACDLMQAPSNPALFDLPPADLSSIDPVMQNFSRPDGVGNPGEGGATTGYVGVQRGVAGQRNLVQIGGGQNSFGVALPPGTGVAESANLIAGVAQSAAQVIASGSFTAPATQGDYVFQIQNAIANVIDQINAPPAFSPVSEAIVLLASPTFSFTVSGAVPGDIDGDGDVDLSDLAALLAAYGACDGDPIFNSDADLDGSGCVDLADLATLLANYGG